MFWCSPCHVFSFIFAKKRAHTTITKGTPSATQKKKYPFHNGLFSYLNKKEFLVTFRAVCLGVYLVFSFFPYLLCNQLCRIKLAKVEVLLNNCRAKRRDKDAKRLWFHFYFLLFFFCFAVFVVYFWSLRIF